MNAKHSKAPAEWVVSAHLGDDQEQFEAEREFTVDALGPAHSALLS